ncbi:hypothetical protein GRF29_185g73541 [Pseudopithomyces chartarum]|uniref:Uncharacterized protein n=1 Tax=Pseudopithomyces chartarum TaxID=1892770 RepID=A0AAN6RC94_9PLEO|nr:hypothetical protein GRF29_185g73541 [Pseudopithomyces chartarum]
MSSSGKSAAAAIMILTAVIYGALHLLALIPFLLYKSRHKVGNFIRRLFTRCTGKRTNEQAPTPDVELANVSAPQLKHFGWGVRLEAPNDDVFLGLARAVTVEPDLARPRMVVLPKMGLPKIVVEAGGCTVLGQVMPGERRFRVSL